MYALKKEYLLIILWFNPAIKKSKAHFLVNSFNVKRKEQMKKNFSKTDAILASDGFFPFPDIVKLCSKNNISGIIQPGGSLNDELVIKEAEKNNIQMVFTGVRHFKH